MSYDKPSYYAVVPAEVRYDKRLRANEKLLYGEISALTSSTGECWASNKYFACVFGVSVQAVSKWISDLQEFGYLTVQYVYHPGTNEIKNRIINMSTKVDEVSTNVDRVLTEVDTGYQQKFKENNTSTNITSNRVVEEVSINNKNRLQQQYPNLDWDSYEPDDYKLKPTNLKAGKGVVFLSTIQEDMLLDYIEDVDTIFYYVGKLADWIDRSGYKVKNHFQTILNWYDEDSQLRR